MKKGVTGEKSVAGGKRVSLNEKNWLLEKMWLLKKRQFQKPFQTIIESEQEANINILDPWENVAEKKLIESAKNGRNVLCNKITQKKNKHLKHI